MLVLCAIPPFLLCFLDGLPTYISVYQSTYLSTWREFDPGPQKSYATNASLIARLPLAMLEAYI